MTTATWLSEFQCRPIDQWPGAFTKQRRRSPFKVGYGSMMAHLQRELGYIGARSTVLLMALQEDEIRLDGRPRANATPRHPGVILVVETAKGTLRFPCDTYDHWSDNLRAIGLALAALRAVDRYGVTKRGEQYTGWKALPSPTSVTPTVEQAKANLRRFIGGRVDMLSSADAIRECRMLTHPDKGGNVADFQIVQEAAKALGVA